MIVRNAARLIGAALIGAALLPGAAAADHAASVAPPFAAAYRQQDGMRVLGGPRGGLETADGFYAQYFEKGRIEFHPELTANAAWRFAYGRLGAELIERGADLPIGGDTSSVSYRDLQADAAPERRVAPPSAAKGPIDLGARGVFVPSDPGLANAPGHIVPRDFWRYLNRADLFPGGWLHDLGLPLTEARSITVTKGGQERTITIQAFERTILTNDLQNPADYRIERANVGSDYLAAVALDAEDAAIIEQVRDKDETDGFTFDVDLQFVDGAYARVRLLPHNTPEMAVDPAWVFLRKTGGAWAKIAGPGTYFDEGAYDQLGIPATLRVGSALEVSLNKTVFAHLKEHNPAVEATLRLRRVAGGFALVQVDPVNIATDPALVYTRLVDVDRWEILGGPGTAFARSFYESNHIPRLLWIATPVED
ncbi:MAG TPA: hypothetical protein VGE07_08400 [Herpetosiphonaceae bacterium]